MQDFDARRKERIDKDRRFLIGGEQFTLKSGVRPEALIAYTDNLDYAPLNEALEIIDNLVISFLEDEDGELRWRRIRENEKDPLTVDDLKDLAIWLVEQQTGQSPTQPPSPSSAGPGTNGTTSMPASPSPESPAEQLVSA